MRTRRLAGWLLCAAVALASIGCGKGAGDERKRALLQPRDGKRKLEQEKEKRRIFDEEGDLLPSGEKVGGVMLPKGLTLYRRLEEHRFYRTTQITWDKLDRWFGSQLISGTVERRDGVVTFGGAVPKDNLKAPRLDLHVTRLRGGPSSSEVYFRLSRSFTVGTPPDQQTEAQLQQARQFRD